MTPAGHLSISYISTRSAKNISIAAALVGAVLPDLDFFLVIFTWFNQAHRIVSHNLLYVALFSIIGVIAAPAERKKAVGLGLLTGGLLHLFVDSIMDNNPSNGVGAAIFWPFYAEAVSPFNLLELQNEVTWQEPLKMFRVMLPVFLYEVPCYLIAAFLFFKRKNARVSPQVS